MKTLWRGAHGPVGGEPDPEQVLVWSDPALFLLQEEGEHGTLRGETRTSKALKKPQTEAGHRMGVDLSTLRTLISRYVSYLKKKINLLLCFNLKKRKRLHFQNKQFLSSMEFLKFPSTTQTVNICTGSHKWASDSSNFSEVHPGCMICHKTRHLGCFTLIKALISHLFTKIITE